MPIADHPAMTQCAKADRPPLTSPWGLGLAGTHQAGHRPIIGIAPPGMNSVWSYFWRRSAGYNFLWSYYWHRPAGCNAFEAPAPTLPMPCGESATTQATYVEAVISLDLPQHPPRSWRVLTAVPGRRACVRAYLTGTSSACTGASRPSRPSATATSRCATAAPIASRDIIISIY